LQNYFVGNIGILVHNTKCNRLLKDVNKVKNNKKANELAKKHGFKDAHEFKQEYVPAKDQAKFDMFIDKNSNEVILGNKDR